MTWTKFFFWPNQYNCPSHYGHYLRFTIKSMRGLIKLSVIAVFDLTRWELLPTLHINYMEPYAARNKSASTIVNEMEQCG